MTTQRSNKRHVAAKRLMQGVAVALIAGAAFAPGLKPHHGSSHGARAAMAVGGPGGAPAGGAGSSSQGDAASRRAPQAHDDGAKGDRGLKLLVDDVAGKGSGPKDAGPGSGTGPDPKGVEPGLPDSFQVAENDTHVGGFGVGGGGGGFSGGGGAGVGGGGGGTGGDPGGTASKPSPDDAPPVQPVVTLPDVDHGGDGPVCVLSSGCDLTAPKGPTPPKAEDHREDGDLPRLPPGDQLKVSEAGPIPEPASWLMMIAGFAALGATLRVRRRKAELA